MGPSMEEVFSLHQNLQHIPKEEVCTKPDSSALQEPCHDLPWQEGSTQTPHGWCWTKPMQVGVHGVGVHPPLPAVPGTAVLLSSHQLTQVLNG